MPNPRSPSFPTQHGYLTEITRNNYLAVAMASGLLPQDAPDRQELTTLTAPVDRSKPIQFWQLFSVLGEDPIIAIVSAFYQRVFADEAWFTSVFARVGGVEHHVVTQASMWADVMGGGPYYHGGEFRLSFHHTHNAHLLMDEKGARRWVTLMNEALEAAAPLLSDDPRLRPSINTFLSHFFAKYAREFNFENQESFGPTNPPFNPG